MPRGRWREWEDHLNQVLSTKPAEVVQEACQVLEKHGWSVKKLKSELYYSSTLCQVVFQVLHYANLIVAHAPTVWTHIHTCTNHTQTHYVYLRGMLFGQGNFCESCKVSPSEHTQRGNAHCLQLKGKPHPFTMVVLTQIV